MTSRWRASATPLEVVDFQRGLEGAGLGANVTLADMERRGFYVCVADLEDELIRSLGAVAVEQVIDAQGDLESFRTFQKQPAWRGLVSERALSVDIARVARRLKTV